MTTQIRRDHATRALDLSAVLMLIVVLAFLVGGYITEEGRAAEQRQQIVDELQVLDKPSEENLELTKTNTANIALILQKLEEGCNADTN